jgi:hypothetical protein
MRFLFGRLEKQIKIGRANYRALPCSKCYNPFRVLGDILEKKTQFWRKL